MVLDVHYLTTVCHEEFHSTRASSISPRNKTSFDSSSSSSSTAELSPSISPKLSRSTNNGGNGGLFSSFIYPRFNHHLTNTTSLSIQQQQQQPLQQQQQQQNAHYNHRRGTCLPCQREARTCLPPHSTLRRMSFTSMTGNWFSPSSSLSSLSTTTNTNRERSSSVKGIPEEGSARDVGVENEGAITGLLRRLGGVEDPMMIMGCSVLR